MGWGLIRPRINLPPVMSGITQAEADWLQLMATGRNVLEIGSAYGASAISMAQTAHTVTAVDPHGFVPLSRDWLHLNLITFGLVGKVITIPESSLSVLPEMIARGEHYDLVFIDGDHRTPAVTADAHNARLLAPLLIFHDYGEPTEPEVAPVVDALFPADVYQRQQPVGSMLAVWL